jgi:hypothetical protein
LMGQESSSSYISLRPNGLNCPKPEKVKVSADALATLTAPSAQQPPRRSTMSLAS